MLVSALLFVLGFGIGTYYNMYYLILSSFSIVLLFFILWHQLNEISGLKVMITIGYLFGHHAGFLLGAYVSLPNNKQ